MKVRTFLLVAILLSLSLATTYAQSDNTYNQAPMLNDAVASGELPPVEERLPGEPMVVAGLEIGQYGGAWRRVANRINDNSNIVRTFGYEPLVRWAPDWSGLVPGAAKNWEMSEDGKVFTFYLHEGMKWSDGMPFTSSDILFWYEDVALNEELNSSPPGFVTSGGKPAVVTAPDDYTVVFTFEEPAGLFLRDLAFPTSTMVTHYARHYFEQFHPKYNPDVEQMAEDQGFESWTELWDSIGGNLFSIGRWNPEVPVIFAWMPAEEVGPDTTILRFERNPYYWKVDPEGNQYPYIDYVQLTVFQDTETLLLDAAAGNVDMQYRHISGVSNRAFLYDNQESGGYHFFTTVSEANNAAIIRLNLNHEDPALNEVFNNKDFRIGMSHAINRQEIIDTVYVGLSTPHQAAPLPGSPFYDEEIATQYIEYDVDLANQYLDEAGYAERDSEGYRLGPNGERISFTLMAVDSFKANSDIVEIVADYWNEVGIEVFPRVVTRNYLESSVEINQFDAEIYPGHGGIDVLGSPDNYFPLDASSHQALRWAAWYNGDERTFSEVISEAVDEEAEVEVDEELTTRTDSFALDPQNELIYRQWALWDLIKTTPDETLQAEYTQELLDLYGEWFPIIGISTPLNDFGVVKNNMGNVPESFPGSWTFASPAPINVFTFFFEDE